MMGDKVTVAGNAFNEYFMGSNDSGCHRYQSNSIVLSGVKAMLWCNVNTKPTLMSCHFALKHVINRHH